MGHKPGDGYRTLLGKLRKGEISEDQFKKEYNNPNNYRPESLSSNMAGKYEQKTKNQPQNQGQTTGVDRFSATL